MTDLVADNAAVVNALGGGPAVIIGHDWGAAIAANSALLRPELFRAVGLLSVPYAPRGGPRPSEVFAQLGGEEEFYVSYFQEPGRAGAGIEPDVRGWLAGFFAALSADTMPGPGAPDPHFGGLDASTTWMADAISAFPVTLPGLAAAHILDGCGHWIQQERPAEVNQLLTGWLAALPA